MEKKPTKVDVNSKVCDTVVRYKGNGTRPMMAGDHAVVFSPLRPLHALPGWLAFRLSENDPDEFEITDEKAPDYGPDSPIAMYDPDTPDGARRLRNAFFHDPEGTYRTIMEQARAREAGLRKIIEEQQERIELLEGAIQGDEFAEKRLREAERTSAADEEQIDYEAAIAHFKTEDALERAIIAYNDTHELKYNPNRAATLRKALNTYLNNPNEDTLQKYAEKIMKSDLPSLEAIDLLDEG
ncbi:MAG TPA: hypothetical protein PK916_08890 [Bacteroidota bacterium]|nr:hypothetical protein [Bacteroidota bacterium]